MQNQPPPWLSDQQSNQRNPQQQGFQGGPSGMQYAAGAQGYGVQSAPPWQRQGRGPEANPWEGGNARQQPPGGRHGQPGNPNPPWHQQAGQQFPQQGEQHGWQEPAPVMGSLPPFDGPRRPDQRSWVGRVTEILPPNYGIVDGNSFYVLQVVMGRHPQVGDSVEVDAVPNTDGGKYEWRCLRVKVVDGPKPAATPQKLRSNPSFLPQPQGGATPMRPQGVGVAGGMRPGMAGSIRPQMGPGGPGVGAVRPQGPVAARGGVAAGKPAAKQQYNQMAPPTNQYTADVALAVAQNVVTGSRAMPTPEVPSRRTFPAAPPPVVLDSLAQKRSQEALKSLTTFADNKGVGLKMLGQMGYGAAGLGLGREGQGITAPVEAAELRQGVGLGFEGTKKKNKGRSKGRRYSPVTTFDRQRDSSSPSPPRRRSVSPSRRRRRSESPSRDRPRYRCEPPSFPPNEAIRAIPQVSKRYHDLYIPPDFCRAQVLWPHSLPDSRPLPLFPDVGFHIVQNKEEANGATVPSLQPAKDAPTVEAGGPDAAKAEGEGLPGSRWSAKVILVGGVDKQHYFQSEVKGWPSLRQRLTFLLGKRGKDNLLAIGGPWAPEDGPHPEQDPDVLARTACRVFKAATGLDLSRCPSWYRFAEYSYLRQADPKAATEEHLEKAVLFLVDASPLATPDPAAAPLLERAQNAERLEQAAKEAVNAAEEAAKAAKKAGEGESGEGSGAPQVPEEEKVDAPGLTVAQLQEELGRRGLETKWNPLKGKKELVDRLQEWLDGKRRAREAVQAVVEQAEAVKQAVTDTARAETEARATYLAAKDFTKTAAKILENPPAMSSVEVAVRPGFMEEKERFTAVGVSLKDLLAYDQADTKEGSVEVGLFAEFFREMLDARYGRGLLRCLAAIERKQSQKEVAKKDAEAAKKFAKPSAPATQAQTTAPVVPGEGTADAAQTNAVKEDEGPLAANGKSNETTSKAEPAVKVEVSASPTVALVQVDSKGTETEVKAEPKAAEENSQKSAATKEAEAGKKRKAEEEVQPAAKTGAKEEAGSAKKAKTEGSGGHAKEEESKPGKDKKEKEAKVQKERDTRSGAKAKEEPDRNGKGSQHESGRKRGREEDRKASSPSRDDRKRGRGGKEGEEKAGAGKDGSRRSGKEPDTRKSSKEDSKSRSAKDSRSARDREEERKKDAKSSKDKDKDAKSSKDVKSKDKDAGRERGKERDSEKGREKERAAEKEKARSRGEKEKGAAEKLPQPPAPGAACGLCGEVKPGPKEEAKPETPAAAPPKQPQPQLPPPSSCTATLSDWGASQGEWEEPMLVACRWFDKEQAGYIAGEDLEEIAFMVSDGMSRKRVQRLVDGVAPKGKFSYEKYQSMPIPAPLAPKDG